jgi:hypothetical protein
MFALTTILSLADADKAQPRNADIALTPTQFAAAHWVAAFLGSRTVDPEPAPEAEAEVPELCDPIPDAEMAPA